MHVHEKWVCMTEGREGEGSEFFVISLFLNIRFGIVLKCLIKLAFLNTI